MNKFLLAAVLFFFSSTVFASGVELKALPENPVIVTSDLTIPGVGIVAAPYFGNFYEITTDRLITVVGIQQVVVAVDGRWIGSFINYPKPFEMKANTSFKTERNFVSEVPAQTSYKYNVHVRLIGWEGSATGNGAPLNTSYSFVTQ